MAFPDWPLSNGSLYPEGWLTNSFMLLEHSHRLTAGLVATLTAVLFGWVCVQRKEVPRGVFVLAVAALAGVLAQAVLGGLRVILDPQGIAATNSATATTFRVLHGCFAQVELCLLVAIAAMLSPVWRALVPTHEWRGIARLGWLTAGLIYLQLIVGATMRHLGAGLAIPTFPETSASGSLMPVVHNAFSDLNFAHTRAGAIIVSLFVVALVLRAVGNAAGDVRIIRPAALLLALVVAQVTMGIQIIWQMRPPILTTLHVVNGAAVLATTVLLALRASRRSENLSTSSTSRSAALPNPTEVPA